MAPEIDPKSFGTFEKRAPDPGLVPSLMVNMIEESRRIRDNNKSNNITAYEFK